MSTDTLDLIVDEFAEKLRGYIDRRIDERLKPRSNGHPKRGDALQVAQLLGCDLSTEEKKKLAKQRVYHLARTRRIPSIRVSPRRLVFDLEDVERALESHTAVDAMKAIEGE